VFRKERLENKLHSTKSSNKREKQKGENEQREKRKKEGKRSKAMPRPSNLLLPFSSVEYAPKCGPLLLFSP